MKQTADSELVGKLITHTGKGYFVEFGNKDGADILFYPPTKPFVVLRVDWNTSRLVCFDILCSDGRIGYVGIEWQEIEFAKNNYS